MQKSIKNPCNSEALNLRWILSELGDSCYERSRASCQSKIEMRCEQALNLNSHQMKGVGLRTKADPDRSRGG